MKEYLFRPVSPFEVDVTSRPLEQRYGSHWFPGTMMLAFGLYWPVLIAIAATRQKMQMGEIFGSLLFAAACLAMAWAGAKWIACKRSVRLDADGVHVTERDLRGTRTWQARFDQFDGIARRSFDTKAKASPRVFHNVIELRHPVESPIILKIIATHDEAESASQAKADVQSYATALNLPVVPA